MKQIYLFGNISDQVYFNQIVRAFPNRFVHRGHIDNKQEMYEQVSDVYLSSVSETWSYIPKECEMTGVNFHGTEAIKDNFELNLSNDEIFDSWMKELER